MAILRRIGRGRIRGYNPVMGLSRGFEGLWLACF